MQVILTLVCDRLDEPLQPAESLITSEDGIYKQLSKADIEYLFE